MVGLSLQLVTIVLLSFLVGSVFVISRVRHVGTEESVSLRWGNRLLEHSFALVHSYNLCGGLACLSSHFHVSEFGLH